MRRDGGLGPRRVVAALLLSVAMILPVPTLAQDQSKAQAQAQDQNSGSKSDKLLELTSQAIGYLLKNEVLRAREPLEQAIAMAADETLPPMARRFPDLPQAQLAYREARWDDVLNFATSFEEAMRDVGFTNHAFRIEATILRAVALYEKGDATTAIPLLRQSLIDSAPLPDDQAQEELARYYLALAATRIAAPDAAELRAAFLNDFNDLGLVSLAQSHFLRYPDLTLGQTLADGYATRKLTKDEIFELCDAGLDLAEAGEMDAAFALIGRANDYTHEAEFDLLTEFYPALAFARYYYIKEDWSEMQRFAAATASVLDRDETNDHPYRIEATVLQGVALFESGRTSEAEVVLRGAMQDSNDNDEIIDLNELAHYFLARAATVNTSTDASGLREGFMARFSGDYLVTQSQALFLMYMSLNAAVSAGEPPEQLITQSEQLLELVDQTDGIEPVYRSFYRGNHGKMLYEAKRFREARVFFEERRAYLTSVNNIGSDYAVNETRLGSAIANTDGIDAARASMLAAVDLLRENGTVSDWALSDLLGQIAFTYRWQKNEAKTQEYFRAAYLELRKARRVTDKKVKFYADLIDPDDPGMAGFALAAELGAIDTASFALTSGGENAIRMFLEGNYAGLERLLAAYAKDGKDGKDETPDYLVNLAIYKAMLGAYDESQSALNDARRIARTSLGNAIPANAPIFDLIDLISKTWGTTHLADKVGGAIARLQARETTLPQGQLSLYLALRVMAKFQSGEDAGIRADIRRWMEAQPAERSTPPDILEQWAYALMGEVIYTYMGPEEGEEWTSRMTGWIEMDHQFDLSLVRDTMRFSYLLSSPTLYSADGALSEMSGLASVILDQMPRDHGIAAATQFNLANAFWSRNRFQEALTWMQAATDSWRANPYHRKDTLAYLISRQANLMLQDNQADVAATLAREAYDMIDLFEARADLAAGVVMTYAYALRMRNDNAEMGGAILKKHIEDAAFMKRLPPRDAIYMHQTYADMLANYAELPVVLEQLDLAEAALPDDNLDWRRDLSQIAMTRAIAIYWNKDYPDAWAAMTRANDIRSEWQRDTIRAGDGDDINAVEAHNRAAWEAIIGWDYAQSLPPDPPPL